MILKCQTSDYPRCPVFSVSLIYWRVDRAKIRVVRFTDANVSFEQDDNDGHERRLLFDDDYDHMWGIAIDFGRFSFLYVAALWWFLVPNWRLSALTSGRQSPVTRRYTSAFYESRASSISFAIENRVARIRYRSCRLYVCLLVCVCVCLCMNVFRRKRSTRFEISVCFVVKFSRLVYVFRFSCFFG